MKRPPDLSEARDRGLLASEKEGILTFSNGTQWEFWAEPNCLSCWFWNKDEAGAGCAFEAAAFLGIVSPELARMFGWVRKDADAAAYYAKEGKPDDPRQFWDEPDQCSFFHERPKRDDGDDDFETPPPPPPDPNQLVLIADPTEDASHFANAPVEAEEPVLSMTTWRR